MPPLVRSSFSSPLNYIRSTLLLAHPYAGGTITLQDGVGDDINSALADEGLPSITTTSPLRFVLIRRRAWNPATQQVLDRTQVTIFKATALTGDVLSGLSPVEGYVDQNFLAGDIFIVENTAGQMVEIQNAVQTLQGGSGGGSGAVIDAGGQVYNVLAYGLIADGLIFTATGSAGSVNLSVFGVIPTEANIGNLISLPLAGTAAAIMRSTVTGVSSTSLVGSITSGTNTITLTTTPSAPPAGVPVVVRGAGNVGSDLYTTLVSLVGNVLTIATNATTSATNTGIVLNATLVLQDPIVTAITASGGRCGTDNMPALLALTFSIRVNPSALLFPTILFPPGTFMFDPTVAAINIGGLMIEGSGMSSILGTFDGPVSGSKVFKGSSGAHRHVIRDLTINYGVCNDVLNESSSFFGSGSGSATGGGCRLYTTNINALGSAASLITLQFDDFWQAENCDLAAGQILFHSGPGSAGVAQGMVRIIGGSISGYGLAGSNQLHGLYMHYGVSCEIDTTFKEAVPTSTGYAIHMNGGAGTALSQVIRSNFQSTIPNGILTSISGNTKLDRCAFACSLTSVTFRGDVEADVCEFRGTTGTSFANLAGSTPANITIRNCTSYDAQTFLLVTIAGWTVKVDACRLTQRTSANAISLTAPTANEVTNCWFSEGAYFGQLPTASLTNAFAILAGNGARYWDTDIDWNRVSDGAVWHQELAVDGLAAGQSITGSNAPGTGLTLKGSSDAAGGPITFNFAIPPGAVSNTGAFDAVGNFNLIHTINQIVTGANFRQVAVTLQDGSTNTGADLTLSTLWTAFQFTYTGTSDTVVVALIQTKRSGTITNTSGTLQALLYTDNAGQPGVAITGSNPLSTNYFNYGTSYASLVLRTGTGQVLTNGVTYWLVLQENVAPGGGTILANVATSNNTNVATGSNGTVWSVAAGPMAFFQILGRHGTSLVAQTTTALGGQGVSTTSGGLQGNSTSSTGITGISVYGAGGNFSSTGGNAIVGATTAGNGAVISTRDGIVASLLQSGTLVGSITSAAVSIVRSVVLGANTCTGALLFANTTVADTGNLVDLQKSSVSQFAISHDGHVLSGGTIPTRTNGTGAGTGPTTSVVAGSTDFRGRISVLTGTSPTASVTVITINFAVAYGTAPFVRIFPANAAAAALTGNAQVWADSASTTVNGFAVLVGSTNLAATTTYLWDYEVIG